MQGGYTTVWTTITGGDVWARVEPLSGSEAYESGMVAQGISHRVVIRYRTGISGKLSVLFGTRRLYIRSATNRLERKEQLELMCDEQAQTAVV